MKQEYIEDLKAYFSKLKKLYKTISALNTVQITNEELRKSANDIAEEWFYKYSPNLEDYGIAESIVQKYDCAFKQILKLSNTSSRRTSYIKQLELIDKSFTDEIIIYLQTAAFKIKSFEMSGLDKEIEELLDKIDNAEENEYLKEAIGCWEHDFLKASVVLAWCAAIDRIHKSIEKVGFTKFNQATQMMKAQTSGRFKKYTKEYNVNSVSELRMVFDSDVLLVLEGMGMIDTNQRARLHSCFEMRCHSGHPGDAPITKYNVLALFSDIIEVVFTNPQFSI